MNVWLLSTYIQIKSVIDKIKGTFLMKNDDLLSLLKWDILSIEKSKK